MLINDIAFLLQKTERKEKEKREIEFAWCRWDLRCNFCIRSCFCFVAFESF